MSKYRLSLVFEELDDLEARLKVKEVLKDLVESERLSLKFDELKLQRLYEDRAPEKVEVDFKEFDE